MSRELLRLKGRFEVDSGKLGEAVKTFKRLTVVDPSDESVSIAYSDILLVSQKYQKCLKFSETARHKFPGQVQLILNQVRCHLFLGNLDTAAGLLATVGSQAGSKGHPRTGVLATQGSCARQDEEVGGSRPLLFGIDSGEVQSRGPG